MSCSAGLWVGWVAGGVFRPEQGLGDVPADQGGDVLPEPVRSQVHPPHPQGGEGHGLQVVARAAQARAVLHVLGVARLQNNARQIEGNEVFLDLVVRNHGGQGFTDGAVDVLLGAKADVGVAGPDQEVALGAEPVLCSLDESLPRVEHMAGIT